ncbi:MAG TPA: hypothetical protein VMG10_27300 [Gemmataceae bacterium]|nr:hypothetical protein [Gemmataceae bacterium]
MLNRPVRPGDCTLALAIPLSEAEFLRDLKNDAPKDLAKSIRREWPLRGEFVYAERYRPLVDIVCDVANEVQSLGVTVCRGTRLADLPALFERHKVVTLVAHWCLVGLRGADILNVNGFCALLRTSARDERDGKLPERPTDAPLRDDEKVRSATTAADLATALNRLLEPTQRYYEWDSKPGEEIPCGEIATAGFTRVHLEEHYPGFIAPARCLELADGLCTVWEFINKVPPLYDGIVDMTICNSIIPAEALRRRRSACNALTNTFKARAEVRLELYRHVIRSLAVVNEPFEEVSARAHRLLLAVLRNQSPAGGEISTHELPQAGLWTRFVRVVRDLLR